MTETDMELEILTGLMVKTEQAQALTFDIGQREQRNSLIEDVRREAVKQWKTINGIEIAENEIRRMKGEENEPQIKNTFRDSMSSIWLDLPSEDKLDGLPLMDLSARLILVQDSLKAAIKEKVQPAVSSDQVM